MIAVEIVANALNLAVSDGLKGNTGAQGTTLKNVADKEDQRGF